MVVFVLCALGQTAMDRAGYRVVDSTSHDIPVDALEQGREQGLSGVGAWWYDAVEEDVDLAPSASAKPARLSLRVAQPGGSLDILESLVENGVDVPDVSGAPSGTSTPAGGGPLPTSSWRQLSEAQPQASPAGVASAYAVPPQGFTAPQLLGAHFVAENPSFGVILTFDAATNAAGMLGVEPCSRVLDAQSVAMLRGDDDADEPQCVWNSETELQADTSSSATVTRGSIVGILPTAVFPAGARCPEARTSSPPSPLRPSPPRPSPPGSAAR